MHTQQADSQFIDDLGGTSAVAAWCSLQRKRSGKPPMTRQAVSRWRIHGIPASWRAALELADKPLLPSAEEAKNGKTEDARVRRA